jgi:hypothetical protein
MVRKSETILIYVGEFSSRSLKNLIFFHWDVPCGGLLASIVIPFTLETHFLSFWEIFYFVFSETTIVSVLDPWTALLTFLFSLLCYPFINLFKLEK